MPHPGHAPFNLNLEVIAGAAGVPPFHHIAFITGRFVPVQKITPLPMNLNAVVGYITTAYNPITASLNLSHYNVLAFSPNNAYIIVDAAHMRAWSVVYGERVAPFGSPAYYRYWVATFP